MRTPAGPSQRSPLPGMILPAVFWLLASIARVQIADDVVEVPPAEWRYLELSLRQQPVTVVCHFDAPANPTMRIAFLHKEDLERLRSDRPHGVLAATPPGPRGSVRFSVAAPGNYAVLLDNREDGRHAARVHLRVALEFGGPLRPHARTLSQGRRLVVILASFAFFFGVLAYAGRRLLASARK